MADGGGGRGVKDGGARRPEAESRGRGETNTHARGRRRRFESKPCAAKSLYSGGSLPLANKDTRSPAGSLLPLANRAPCSPVVRFFLISLLIIFCQLFYFLF